MNNILKLKVSSIVLLLLYFSHEFRYSGCSSNRTLIAKLQNVSDKYQESVQKFETYHKFRNNLRHQQNCYFDVLKHKFRIETNKLINLEKLDFVFILDDSDTIGRKHLLSFISFVKRFAANFDTSINGTRIAIINFDSNEQIVRSVYRTKSKPLEDELIHIPFIQYFGRKTNVFNALKSSQAIFNFWRKNAQKAIILISTGYLSGDDPRPLAKTLIESGIKIFTIGIQNGNIINLEDIASKPKNEHNFVLNSFENIEALVNDGVINVSDSCYLFCKEYSDSCVCIDSTETESCDCGYLGRGLKSVCNRICPETQHQVFNKLLNRMECQCRKGYFKVGDKCEVTKCPKLVAPENGFFSSECRDVYNAACGLICRPGYQLKGTSIRICTESGAWDGVQTYCLVRKCPELKAPENGTIDCTTNDFRFETVCHFGCESRFQLQGSRERTCLAIAKWDGLPVICKPILSNSNNH